MMPDDKYGSSFSCWAGFNWLNNKAHVSLPKGLLALKQKNVFSLVAIMTGVYELLLKVVQLSSEGQS